VEGALLGLEPVVRPATPDPAEAQLDGTSISSVRSGIKPPVASSKTCRSKSSEIPRPWPW
jgi:hypothetical protein